MFQYPFYKVIEFKHAFYIRNTAVRAALKANLSKAGLLGWMKNSLRAMALISPLLKTKSVTIYMRSVDVAQSDFRETLYI